MTGSISGPFAYDTDTLLTKMVGVLGLLCIYLYIYEPRHAKRSDTNRAVQSQVTAGRLEISDLESRGIAQSMKPKQRC